MDPKAQAHIVNITAALTVALTSAVSLYSLRTLQQFRSTVQEALLVTVPAAISADTTQPTGLLLPGQPPSLDPLIVEVYSDFGCRFCRASMAAIDSARAVFGNQIRWLYRFVPQPPHLSTLAFGSSVTVRCLQDQGLLSAWDVASVSAQRPFTDRAFQRVLLELGSSADAIAACGKSSEAETRVWRDKFDAARRGVLATPTLLVNDVSVRGQLETAPLLELLHTELSKPRRVRITGD